MAWDAIAATGRQALRSAFQNSSGATPSTFVVTNYVTKPTKALKSDKEKLRVAVEVGVVTVLLAVCLALIFCFGLLLDLLSLAYERILRLSGG